MERAAVLVALVVTCLGQKVPDSGYLFTAPKVLQAGTTERACLSLHKLAGPGRTVNLAFFERDAPRDQLTSLDENDFLLFKTSAAVPDDVPVDGEYCFDIAVPATVTTNSAQLKLEVVAGDQTFKEESKVTIQSESFLTLVQTDKAKYQPGQKVMFRVITLSHDLMALVNDLKEVWVTTPQGIRVAQWRDVKSNTGMTQLEMKLTEEPPLGHWTIHVSTPNEVITKNFVVEEYVLPTFEVTVEAPEKIENSERTITTKICGKYTFGKPLVSANITVNVSASISSYTYRNNKNLQKKLTDYQLSDGEGCAIFDLLVSKIGIGARGVGGGNTITLSIEVEEEGTGLKQKTTKTVQQEYNFIRLFSDVADNGEQFIKPKLPFYGQYSLEHQDGSPAVGEIIKVCYDATYKDRATSSSDEPKGVPKDIIYKAYKKYQDSVLSVFGYKPIIWETSSPSKRTTKDDCREYLTDKNGDINFFIPAQAEDIDKVEISTSTRVGDDSTSNYQSLTSFFSPSGSYISIDAHTLPKKLPCSGDVTVDILTTQKEPLAPLVYKILSRGRLIKIGQLTSYKLTVSVLPKMGPEFKLLVYYIREDGEIVTDSRVFKVAKCFPNQVEVSWDAETVKPGDSASFTVRAAPNSVCGVSAVDRSTELLGTGNQITLDTVFDELQQFIIRRHQSPNQVEGADAFCRKRQLALVRAMKSGGATAADLTEPKPEPGSDGGGKAGSSHFRPPRPARWRTDRTDAIKAFDTAGFLALTNLAIETRQCYKRVEAEEIPQELLNSVQRGPGGGISFMGLSSPPRTAAFESAQLSPALGQPNSSGGGDQQQAQVRDFFPEAFLFSIETLDANGVKTLTSEMPDTITSWVGSAICTNGQSGFGLSNKTSITTFKPFFTSVSVPYSLKRGEVLKASASVFNFLDSSLSVYLELAESDQYSLATADAPAGFDLCIAAGRTEVKQFPLTFSHLGEVNITVSVRVKDGNCKEANAVAPGSDTVIKRIVVKPEGFPQEKTTSHFICLDEGDNNYQQDVELPVPNGLVPDSERAFYAVVGDLLGPTYDNLESGLIAAPKGGGEPNMITLVPNIHIRAYLEEARLLSERQRRQTDNNMKSGYQRQLRYRRYDGSYSSYGSEDPQGSLWLTAFVVKAFKEASAYIAIDKEALTKSTNWVLSHQNPDGCFDRVGELIHKEMKGGTERGGPAALTAFVMLALKDVATSDQLARGFACLEDGLVQPNKTLYSEILMAHTYLKMGQAVKGKRLVEKLLKKGKREGDDILFWEGDRSTIIGGSRAVDIEMTSYMVLSLLEISGKGYLEDAARAVRWINTQRNSKGGFVATQDTVMAVQALTAFADRTFSSELTSTVAVTAAGVADEVTVRPTNRLLSQMNKVEALQLPSTVSFVVSPPGCVVVQTFFRFSSTIKVPDPAFSLGVATKARGRTGSSYEVEVCTSFLRSSGSVDRVILEMELPSGYIPVDSALRALRASRAVRNYDASEGSITFTISRVTEDKTCLGFRILQENEVEELKPSVVKVYDFYRPEEKNIVEYELTAVAA